jgi:hypothetical protein
MGHVANPSKFDLLSRYKPFYPAYGSNVHAAVRIVNAFPFCSRESYRRAVLR